MSAITGILFAASSSSASSAIGDIKNDNPWTTRDAELIHRKYNRRRVQDKEFDYIIVGSGIGGLWLGACLSKFNYSSLVLEQHATAGGFQHTFRRGPYEFVPGLHYIANLALCAPLYDMVAAPTNPPLRFHASEGDQRQSHTLKVGCLPTMYVRKGARNVRSELLRVFPNETFAVDNFLQLTEISKWQAGQFATFRVFPPWIQWLLSQTMCSSYIYSASLTTSEILEPLTRDGRLATVLSAFGGDLGESLAEGSFVMQAAVLGHVYEGCHYPEGGPIQFVRGLVPTIRSNGVGDVLVSARVDEILIEEQHTQRWHRNRYRATGVRLANGDVVTARRGIVSDAGILSTLVNLLPKRMTASRDAPLRGLLDEIEALSGGISHVFLFVGLNASTEELRLQSSSFYYIPWNSTTAEMNATAIQDYYRNTLLDPNVLDVSAGMVFCTAKDPVYSAATMPNKSTVIVFSEARAEHFDQFVDTEATVSGSATGKGRKRVLRTKEYGKAKQLIERKMMRSLLMNFPHLEPFVDVVEVGTPLTIIDYTLRSETLGLRHTPRRMTSLRIRPDCENVDGLYFTGQDVAFAGWAGALTGAMVTAQKLLGYTLADFAQGKTLMRDLGRGDVEDMIRDRVKQATAGRTLFDAAMEILGNGVRHIQRTYLKGK